MDSERTMSATATGRTVQSLVSYLVKNPSRAVCIVADMVSKGFTAELIDEAISAGLIEAWPDCPAGPAVMLSSVVAARNGLVLDDDPETDVHLTARWIKEAEPDLKSRTQFDLHSSVHLVHEKYGGDSFDVFASQDPGPTEAAESNERLEHWYPSDPDVERSMALEPASRKGPKRKEGQKAEIGVVYRDYHAPDHIPSKIYDPIGSGKPGWSRSDETDHVFRNGRMVPTSGCQVCCGRKVSRTTVCLGCLRSGLDDALPPITTSDVARKSYSKDGTLRGGVN
jgi:hypothetical protein